MQKHTLFLSVTFLATILLSCNSKTIAKFEIVNTTNETIDSCQILPDNAQKKYVVITPKSKVSYNIDMTGLSKVDGSYRLSYKSKTKNVVMPFGYYTNGYPLESLTTIFIQPDTVLIKPEYSKDH